MKNLFFKKHSLLIKVLIPVLVIAGLVLPLHQAQAWIGALASNIIFAGVAVILQFAVGLSAVVLFLGRVILNIVISPNFITVPYTSEGIVGVGWPIVRDFANLGFSLALVFIGLATALQINDYGAKKTLPRLLAMALLVNFTPVIAGIIVDASNIITNFFLGATGDFSAIENLGSSYRSNLVSNLNDFFTKSVVPEIIAMSVAAFLFNVLAGFFFLLYAVLFIVRHIAIWTLVIISPIAFFANVFPKTSSYYKQWWTQFIQWCFIGVPASFFLYLSWHLLDQASSIIIAPPPNAWPGFEGVGPSLSSVLVYGVVLVFLMLGFLGSLSSGASGATAIISTAKSLGKSAAGSWKKGTGAIGRAKKGMDLAKKGAQQLGSRAGREMLLSKPIGDLLQKGIESKQTGIPGWLIRTGALKGREMKANMASDITKMRNDPTLQALLANNDFPGMAQWIKSSPLKLDQDKRLMAVASLIGKEKKEAGLLALEKTDSSLINKASDKMGEAGLLGLINDMASDSPTISRREKIWRSFYKAPEGLEETKTFARDLKGVQQELIQIANKVASGKALSDGDNDWIKKINEDLVGHGIPTVTPANLGATLGLGRRTTDLLRNENDPLFMTIMAERAERKSLRGLGRSDIAKLGSGYTKNAHSAELFVKTRSPGDAIELLDSQGPAIFDKVISARQRLGPENVSEAWARAPYAGATANYFPDFENPVTHQIIKSLEEIKDHRNMMSREISQLTTEFRTANADKRDSRNSLRKINSILLGLDSQIAVKNTMLSTTPNTDVGGISKLQKDLDLLVEEKKERIKERIDTKAKMDSQIKEARKLNDYIRYKS